MQAALWRAGSKISSQQMIKVAMRVPIAHSSEDLLHNVRHSELKAAFLKLRGFLIQAMASLKPKLI